MLNVAVYPSDHTACSWQRAWFPFWWAKKLKLLDVRFCYGADERDAEWADLIVYQRHYDPGDPPRWWTWLGGKGKKRVYEIDDDVFAMPKDNPFEKDFDTYVKRAVQRMLREADLVTCSTDGLAQSMSRFNKRTVVIPNGIDPQVFDLVVQREPERTRIFFIGSRTHDKDFALALPALQTVLASYPTVDMVFVGDPPWGALEALPFKSQVYALGWIPYEELYLRLAQAGPDIVVAPLTNHPFNRAKSSIKWMEASALGAVTIASPVSDFAKFCVDGETALLPTSMREWEAALVWMIEAPDYRRRIAEQAKQVVREQFGYDVLAPRWASAITERMGR